MRNLGALASGGDDQGAQAFRQPGLKANGKLPISKDQWQRTKEAPIANKQGAGVAGAGREPRVQRRPPKPARQIGKQVIPPLPASHHSAALIPRQQAASDRTFFKTPLTLSDSLTSDQYRIKVAILRNLFSDKSPSDIVFLVVNTVDIPAYQREFPTCKIKPASTARYGSLSKGAVYSFAIYELTSAKASVEFYWYRGFDAGVAYHFGLEKHEGEWIVVLKGVTAVS